MPSVKITCLVNNSTKLSSHFWGEHGLSFFINAEEGSFFFDTGQTPEVLKKNISLLNIEYENTQSIVLSHGHYDHTGGLKWLAGTLEQPKIYADPHVFIGKYAIRDQTKKSIGLPLTRQQLEELSELHLSTDPVELFPGVMISGRISRTNIYEKHDGELYTLSNPEDPDSIIPDIMLDDRCVIINTNKGAVILLGCCHSGIINTLTYTRQFYTGNLYAVIGGTHMASISEERRRFTVAKIKQEFSPEHLYLNHCTGEKTLMYLSRELGDYVESCPVGTIIEA